MVVPPPRPTPRKKARGSSRCKKSLALILLAVVAGIAGAYALGFDVPEDWFEVEQLATIAGSSMAAPAGAVAAAMVSWACIRVIRARMQQASQPKRVVSKRINVLIERLGSSDAKRMEAIAQEEIGHSASLADIEQQLAATKKNSKLNVVAEAKSEWRIHGLYVHQVLKCGLRHLDKTWPEDTLWDKVDGKNAGGADNNRFAGRSKLILDMLGGKILLQSIPAADVQATQYGIRSLNLRQLLRLRALHIDFVPSGCGRDGVGQVAVAHEAFMVSLDNLLFTRLGERAMKSLNARDAQQVDSSEMHAFGRDAVLLSAAAASMKDAPKKACWCWYRSGKRWFFNPNSFTWSGVVPCGTDGILEVADLSKRDAHEPTGNLFWFDWRMKLVFEEGMLGRLNQGLHKQLSISPSLLEKTRSGLRKMGREEA